MDAGKLTLLQVNLFLLARQRLAGGWGVGAILLEQRRDEDPSWHLDHCVSSPLQPPPGCPWPWGQPCPTPGRDGQMAARSQLTGPGHISLIKAN